MTRKIVLWGIGTYAEYVYESLLSECKIVAIIDGNPEKQKKLWKDDLIIESPDFVNKIVYDYIVVTPLKYREIRQHIYEMGIPENKIICYWEDKEEEKLLKNRILDEKYYKDVYRARLDSAPYEWGLKEVPVIEEAETLLKIIENEKKSLSRYGDGEFEIMRGNNRPWFQTVDKKLAERLIEVFQSEDERILIAAAQNFTGFDKFKEEDADEIRIYMEGKTREDIIGFFNPSKKYYDTYVSRPYIIYKTNTNAKKIFPLFKKIWNNRDVVMVEGEYGRTGVGNNLFEGAKSVKRIVCPAKNAWNVYDKILKCIIKNCQKDDLICISLGPTASVLSYDLTTEGYQALDIGQLDNEYEWYLMKTEKRVPIKGKMVAEVNNHYEKDEIIDEEYEKDVICRIGED